MTPNSIAYIAFLLAAAVVHSLLPARCRTVFLLLASYGFYLLCSPKALPLLLAATAWNYALARAMEDRPARKKLWLILGLCLDLGVLFLFKYLNFSISLIDLILGRAPGEPMSLLMPAGVSFYTFTVCGSLMDVYRGKRPAERSIVRFALFVAFFPAILSGPIERAGHLLPQLEQRRRASLEDWQRGSLRFLIGLCKKMVLADRLAILVNAAFAVHDQCTGAQLLAAALAYSLQIYCDFSAYSDMAIGSARLLGVTLAENFDSPYFSHSIKDFWRRWHISLSSWFRDYLYVPLGGSRKGKARTWLNLLIVFALSGLWHGAALTFVVWGVLNGMYQIVGDALLPLRQGLYKALRLGEDCLLLRVVQTVIVFLLSTVAWVFFRAGSMAQALEILRRIFTATGGFVLPDLVALGIGRSWLLVVGVGVILLFLFDLLDRRRLIPERLCAVVAPRYAVCLALVLAALIFGAYGAGYDAQEFVYFRF